MISSEKKSNIFNDHGYKTLLAHADLFDKYAKTEGLTYLAKQLDDFLKLNNNDGDDLMSIDTHKQKSIDTQVRDYIVETYGTLLQSNALNIDDVFPRPKQAQDGSKKSSTVIKPFYEGDDTSARNSKEKTQGYQPSF